MKKNFLFFALTIISLHSFAQQSFTINGKLQGLTDGRKIKLIPGATHKQENPLFETKVFDGTFTLTGKVEEPRFFYLTVEDSLGFYPLFIENSDIKISGNFTTDSSSGQARAVFSEVEVKGSKVHDLYLEKTKIKKELDKAYQAYNDDNKVILDSLSKFSRGSAERKEIEQSEAYKKYEQDEKAFFTRMKRTYETAIKENSVSFWGPFLMLNFMNYFTEKDRPWYDNMSEKAKNSFYGKLVYKELYPETLMGKIAPGFTESDQNGKEFSLNKLLDKYTIVDFWASWCAPCRKEIPNLKKLYEQYNSKGLAIVSISIDKSESSWKKALDQEQLPWTNLIDKDGTADKYGVRAIPDMFILDQKGMVIGVKLSGESLAQKLKELFSE